MRRPLLLLSIVLLAGAGALLLLLRRRRRTADRAHRFPTAPAATPAPAPAEPGIRFVSVPWTLVAADPETRRLTIRYAADVHMELDRVDAQETPTQVFVTVMARWRPPAGGRFAYVQEREADVALARPLGERELVHAPVDDPSAAPLYP